MTKIIIRKEVGRTPFVVSAVYYFIKWQGEGNTLNAIEVPLKECNLCVVANHASFPRYRLNMIRYEVVSWLEVLINFGITKNDVERMFRTKREA